MNNFRKNSNLSIWRLQKARSLCWEQKFDLTGVLRQKKRASLLVLPFINSPKSSSTKKILPPEIFDCVASNWIISCSETDLGLNDLKFPLNTKNKKVKKEVLIFWFNNGRNI